MKRSDITIHARHRDKLQALLAHPRGHEGAAYMLLGKSEIAQDPWDLVPRTRYTSYEVIAIPQEDRVDASDKHVTWNTNFFARLCRRAKEEGLVPAIVHSHPGGFDGFSPQDDRNERELFTMARNRNGARTRFVSVVQVGDNLYRARVWEDEVAPLNCRRVIVIGTRIEIQSTEVTTLSEALSRQALAFGPEVNSLLKQLSVAVVGCGGTGSPVIQLLARLGVGRRLPRRQPPACGRARSLFASGTGETIRFRWWRVVLNWTARLGNRSLPSRNTSPARIGQARASLG
jgi:hypothetical protein